MRGKEAEKKHEYFGENACCGYPWVALLADNPAVFGDRIDQNLARD